MKNLIIFSVFATMLASCATRPSYTDEEINAINSVYTELGGKEQLAPTMKLKFIKGRLNYIDEDTIGETDNFEIVHDLIY